MAWQDSSSKLLCFSTYTPSQGWSAPFTPSALAALQTNDAPALAVFQDKLVVMWTAAPGTANSGLYCITCGVGDAWSLYEEISVPNAGHATHAPAMAVLGDKLHVVFNAGSNPAYLTQNANGTWSVPSAPELGNDGLQGSPALAVFDGQLHLMWLGFGMDGLFTCASSNGESWSPQQSIPSTAAAGFGPSLAVLGGDFLMTVADPSGGVQWAQYNPSNATWEMQTETAAVANNFGGASLGVYWDSTMATVILATPAETGLEYATYGDTLPAIPQFGGTPITVGSGLTQGASICQQGEKRHAAWGVAQGPFTTASYDNATNTWRTPSGVAGSQVGSTGPVALVPWGSRVYGLYPCGTVYAPAVSWAICEDDAWTNVDQTVPGAAPLQGVGAAVFNNALYVTWADSKDQTIHMQVATQGTDAALQWLDAPVALPAGSGSTPMLAVVGDTVCLVWRGVNGDPNDNAVYFSSLQAGSTQWAAQQLVPVVSCQNTPAIAAFGNVLHMVSLSVGGGSIQHATMSADGGWRLMEAIPGEFSLTTYPAPLCLGAVEDTLLVGVVQPNGTLISLPLSYGITVDSRLTRDFRMAHNIAGSTTQMLAVNQGQDAVGLVVLPSAATSSVCVLTPDEKSNTGWNNPGCGLPGSTTPITAAALADGRLIVFQASGTGFTYAVQKAPGSVEWTATQQVAGPGGTVGMVAARTLGGTLYVAALVSNGTAYTPYVTSGFEPDAPSFGTLWSMSTFPLDLCLFEIAAVSNQPAMLGLTPTQWLSGNLSPASIAFTTLPAPMTSASVVHDASGCAWLFGTTGGNAVWISAPGNPVTINAIVPPPGVTVTFGPLGTAYVQNQLSAQCDVAGLLELFVVASDGKLYHGTQSAVGSTTWSSALPLLSNVLGVASVRDGDGHSHAFCTMKDGTVQHLWQNEAGGWNGEMVAVQSGGSVVDVPAYAMECRITAANGQAAPFARVTLSTSAPAVVRVNGKTLWLDATRPANVTADALGRLCVVQEARGLATDVLQLSSPMLGAGQPLTLMANADVEYRLRTLTREQVLAARDKDGKPLLPGSDAQRDRHARKIAAVVNASMALVPPTTGTEAAFALRGNRKGRRYRMPQQAQPSRARSFHADFSNLDQPECVLLTAQLARERAEHLRGAFGLWSLVTSAGDVWQAIRSGAAKVKEVVVEVEVAQDAVNATIKLVVDGVDAVWTGVIDVMEQALDLVQGVWQRFKVSFDSLCEWIGTLFDWDNILRVQDAGVWMLDQMVSFLAQAGDGLKENIKKRLKEMEDQVASIFSSWSSNPDNTSVGNLVGKYKGTDTTLEEESANNLLFNALLQQSGDARASKAARPFTPRSTQAKDSVLGALRTYVDSLKQANVVEPFTNSMKSVGTNTSTALDLGGPAFFSTVQALVTAGIGSLHTPIHAVVDSATTDVQSLWSSINSEWHIPYVSDVYAHLTTSEGHPNGRPLRLADVFALVAAVPINALYTGLCGEAPFPTQKALDDFKANVTAENLLAACGFTHVGSDSAQWVPAPMLRDFCSVAYSVVLWAYGAVEAFIDGMAGQLPDATDWPGALLTGLDFCVSLATQMYSFPLDFFDSSVPRTDLVKMEFSIWCLQWLFTGLTIFTMVAERKLPRFVLEIPCAIYGFLGLFHAGMFMWLMFMEHGTQVAKSIQYLLCTIPEIGKWAFIVAKEDIPHGGDRYRFWPPPMTVLAVIDGVALVAAGAINLGRFIASKQPVAALPAARTRRLLTAGVSEALPA